MDNILDFLYKMSNEFSGLLNGLGGSDETFYWKDGKVLDKNEYEEYIKEFYENRNTIGEWVVSENGGTKTYEIRDCRSDEVDIAIKKFIRDRLYYYVSLFGKENNEDDTLLFMGFSINLYYILGLYQTFGKFDINEIGIDFSENSLGDYAKLIEKYLYLLNRERIINIAQYLNFSDVDLYNATIKTIFEQKTCDEYNNLLNSIDETDRKYVPELYKFLLEESVNESKEEAETVLEKMITVYPNYKFGQIYMFLDEAKSFYQKKGVETNIYKWREYLGVKLFLHVLGIKRLDQGEFEFKDGKIQNKRPAIFSNFGIGIPTIKTVSRERYWDHFNPNEILDNKKHITLNEDIRKQTAAALGIEYCVQVEENPLVYIGSLFEKLSNKEDELKKRNDELEKLREQKVKLVNHLAHSWGNECYPEIVKKVADELLKVGNSSLANRLFKAYNSENNLMGEIIFLQAAMDDNPETLKNIFTNSFYISGEGTDEMKIGRLVEDTLEIIIFGLLNDKQEKEKRKKCCEKISIQHSISELADDYVKRFEEMNKEESFVNWFCDNIFPLNITIDDTWKKINMGQTEYGKIVLKNIFTELITNVLIHGKNWCEISFKSSKERMYIEVKNAIDSDVGYNRKGLSSLREIVSRLNYDTCVSESEGIVHGAISGNEYVTTITFAKELMVIEEDW